MVGAGASHMHKGIPHLHSITPAAELFWVAVSIFESVSVSMSNLETLSATEFTPYEEACGLMEKLQKKGKRITYSAKWNKSIIKVRKEGKTDLAIIQIYQKPINFHTVNNKRRTA